MRVYALVGWGGRSFSGVVQPVLVYETLNRWEVLFILPASQNISTGRKKDE